MKWYKCEDLSIHFVILDLAVGKKSIYGAQRIILEGLLSFEKGKNEWKRKEG